MLLKILGCAAAIVILLALVAWNVSATACMERTFNAPADKIWTVWNDPDAMKKWWGPKNYTAPVIRNDLRVGGTYLWAMRSPQGELFWNTGTYTEIIPNKRITSTLSFSNELGHTIPGSKVLVPGRWPNEIRVIVEFNESGGNTRVTVTEIGIPLIVKVLSKIAWAQQFDKIQSLL